MYKRLVEDFHNRTIQNNFFLAAKLNQVVSSFNLSLTQGKGQRNIALWINQDLDLAQNGMKYHFTVK